MVMPTLHIRPLTAADQALLWDILHIALWDPPPAPLRPREVLDQPGVRIYAENWGRDGDIGVIGEWDGAPVGGVWVRRITGGTGLAYVDDDTPQLGVGLFPDFQRRGFGSILFGALLKTCADHGFKQVSLTVHPENPAIALYERFGFEKIGLRGSRDYHLMLARL
jgi:ribosomal protein S18 acetylase RimI-like enzyme